MKARALILSTLLGMTACSAPVVPDFNYFRLPRPQPVEPLATPLFADPLVVDAFGADGLYADQSLIYALDADAQQLRQYHYQLWTDPPVRMLQRRLIATLREAKFAVQVTDELPASHPAIRIRGVILRFDRVPAADGHWNAVVALKLRADSGDGMPLVDDYYRAEAPAADASMKTTVAAYGSALDSIYAQFQADLRKRHGGVHAG